MRRNRRNSGWEEEDWEDTGHEEEPIREEKRPSRRRKRRTTTPEKEEEGFWPSEYEEEEPRPQRRKGRNRNEKTEEVFYSVGDRDIESGSSVRTSRRKRSSRAFGLYIPPKLIATVAVGLILLIVLPCLGKQTPPPQETPPQTASQLQKEFPPVQETSASQPEKEFPAAQETASQTGDPIVVAPNLPIPRPSENRYFRNKLTDQERDVYDTFLYCIEQHQPKSQDVFVEDLSQLDKIMDFILWDYTEYFWFRSWVYYSVETPGGYTVSLEPQYVCTAAERVQQQQVVDAGAQPIISLLEGKSDYEKVVGVYRYLVDLFRYDLSYKGTSLYENFRDNRSVCEGYAKATKYILTKLGVETLYVVGYTTNDNTGEGHAWNIVKVDGVYYQLDTTWGDPVTEDGSQSLVYDYCMVDDAIMQRNHIYDTSMYPACNALDAHYFVKEGRYFFEYNRQRITELLRVPVANQEEISFRFANEQAYQEAKNRLLENDEIWDVVNDLGWKGERNHSSYTANDETYVISLTVTKN